MRNYDMNVFDSVFFQWMIHVNLSCENPLHMTNGSANTNQITFLVLHASLHVVLVMGKPSEPQPQYTPEPWLIMQDFATALIKGYWESSKATYHTKCSNVLPFNLMAEIEKSRKKS